MITIYGSSANLGPGFDTLGMALDVKLTLEMEPCDDWTIEYSGEGTVDLNPHENLITRVAFLVANAFGILLTPVKLIIVNCIPLSRGLGSSGTAVVAGILLANVLGKLNLSDGQMLDYATWIEGHPDNVAASILGGAVVGCVTGSFPELKESYYIPGTSVPRLPSLTMTCRIPISSKVKAVVCVPSYHLSTKTARGVLPSSYPISDVVYNLQRVSCLVVGLSEPLQPHIVRQAMKDIIHQPYRVPLIPGLDSLLKREWDLDGFLGICLSGAGPTVLALACGDYEEIGRVMEQALNGTVSVLDLAPGYSISP